MHAHEFNPFNERRRQQMLEAYLNLVAVVPVFDVRFQPGVDHFPLVLEAMATIVGRGQPVDPREWVAR
jgi:hypothetical protein